jgi:hypothetical protein
MLVLVGIGVSAALAQGGRAWVDPPARTEPPAPPPAGSAGAAPPPSAPSPEASPVAAPPPEPASPPPAVPIRPAENAPASAPGRADATVPKPETGPPIRSAEPPPPAAPAAPSAPAVAAEKAAALKLAGEYLDFWSAPNVVTLEATPEFYAPRVAFHGREMSAAALFKEKRRFVQRWPVRSYRSRPQTTETDCDAAAALCMVKSIFDFTAISPERGKRSEGVATLELVISVAGPRPLIVAETSRILHRGRTKPAVSFEEAEDE